MKQFKLVLFAAIAVVLMSCEEGVAKIEQTLVVEQVNVIDEVDKDCDQCEIDKKYKYKMKIKTSSGSTYYYTDYKHEVGDTLISSHMFIQQEVEDRAELKDKNDRLQKLNDSLIESNITMKFQYDLMLQFFENKVIPGEIEKSKNN